MREAMKRFVFNNYDTDSYEEYAKEAIHEEYGDDYEPSDSEVWNRVDNQLRTDWEEEKSQLESFFDNFKKIFVDGSIGRWNGTQSGFETFDNFEDLFRWATEDCDYWKIWDENGHLFLKCSHHDGTNLFEIKTMTDKGIEYLENWDYSWNDKRTVKDVHEQLYKRYTRLPRYAEKQWGSPKVQFA